MSADFDRSPQSQFDVSTSKLEHTWSKPPWYFLFFILLSCKKIFFIYGKTFIKLVLVVNSYIKVVYIVVVVVDSRAYASFLLRTCQNVFWKHIFHSFVLSTAFLFVNRFTNDFYMMYILSIISNINHISLS